MKTQPGHLLLVESDPATLETLTQSLTLVGHTVEAAASGADALDKMRRTLFDVVLLHDRPPGIGYETLGRIRDDSILGEASVVLLKSWNADGLRALVDDCLEKKRADEEAKRFAAELQEAERLRDDLAHMIVHDLRTPLTSLLTGMMTMHDLGPLNADQREFVDAAIHGGQTLLGMINDLLDISKMEAGALTLTREPLNAAALIGQATEQVAWLLDSNAQYLVCEIAEGLPPLWADADKLCRVLTNLLGNAVKFTPHDGIITVCVEATEEGDGLRFEVRDTGVGIPSEALGRIFEKFGQVASGSAAYKRSTGLGLTFCKMVVEAHGGRIWVESAVDQGSVFSFVIPCSPPDESE